MESLMEFFLPMVNKENLATLMKWPVASFVLVGMIPTSTA